MRTGVLGRTLKLGPAYELSSFEYFDSKEPISTADSAARGFVLGVEAPRVVLVTLSSLLTLRAWG